jgi:hypothetical protein
LYDGPHVDTHSILDVVGEVPTGSVNDVRAATASESNQRQEQQPAQDNNRQEKDRRD